jgi:hypothetical protein
MNALGRDATPDSPVPNEGEPSWREEERSRDRAAEPQLIVEGYRGEQAVIVGADAIFALMRRANAALRDGDRRKITAGWLARVETVRDIILDVAVSGDPDLTDARRQLAEGWEEIAAVVRSIVGVERDDYSADR